MNIAGRPTVDLVVRVTPQEWRELYRHSLQPAQIWVGAGLATLVVGVGVAAWLQAGTDPATAAVCGGAAALAVVSFVLSYLVVGPWLHSRSLREDLPPISWQLRADGLTASAEGAPVMELAWAQVRTLVLTERMALLELRHGRPQGLPRRSLGVVGEALLTEWAAAAGVTIRHRDGSSPDEDGAPGPEAPHPFTDDERFRTENE